MLNWAFGNWMWIVPGVIVRRAGSGPLSGSILQPELAVTADASLTAGSEIVTGSSAAPSAAPPSRPP
jgi:hypothetical protein